MQGLTNGFWKWPNESGYIVDDPLLVNLDGYPHLAFLEEAKRRSDVATIIQGNFRTSNHAVEALSDRVYQFPILAPYFHFAFGFAWAFGLAITSTADNRRQAPSIGRWILAGVCSPVVFLLPINVTFQLLCRVMDIPLKITVPVSLAFSMLPILLALLRNKNKGSFPSFPDPLLFLISFGMHVFFVSFPNACGERRTRWIGQPGPIDGSVASHCSIHLLLRLCQCNQNEK